MQHTEQYQEDNDEWLEYREAYITSGSSQSYIQWHDLREHLRKPYDSNNTIKLHQRPNLVKAYFNKKIPGGLQKKKNIK